MWWTIQSEKELKNHIISHSYKAAGDLQFKCDECDFWGPNAQTMVMHFRRNHSENISCGLCDFEAKDIETLDIHTLTYEIFICNRVYCGKYYKTVSVTKKY